MKISDLFEAENWREIQDPALRWLGRFTWENQGKNPSSHVLDELITDYPNQAGTVFRGINFDTQQQWENFYSNFNNKNQAVIEFNVVTSWTSDPTTADQFARTQPTYQPNLYVMTAHSQQTAQREHMIGYRGVILSLDLQQGQAIDVNATGVGHEDEIVVPPGKYLVNIHKIIKKYEHQLADKDTNVDKVVLQTTREDIRKQRDNSLFDYVLHHHGQDLSARAKNHLLKLFGPEPGKPIFLSDVDQYYDRFRQRDEIRVDYGIPTWRLFELADQGIFDPVQKTKIQQLGRKIISQALPVVEEYAAKATYFEPRLLKYIAKVSNDNRIARTMQQVVGKRIRELNDQVRDINKIKDPRLQAQAVEKYKNEFTTLLSRVNG